jgi:hypothetical protein
MSAVSQPSGDFFATLGGLRFPTEADARLQTLMDRNTERLLTDTERCELEQLVELSQTLGLLRAQALGILRRIR